MIRHLFTLIWNRKKQNFLMVTEIFFSFIVLFGVLSLGFYYLNNFSKPLGYNYDKVWVITMRWSQDTPEQIRERQRELLLRIRSNPQVQDAALVANNLPYSMNTSNTMFSDKGHRTMAQFFQADEHYQDIMQLKITEGRWFKPQDADAHYLAVVINQAMRDKLYPQGEKVIGKVVEGNSGDTKGPKSRIVGVMETYRQKGEYSADEPGYFQYKTPDRPRGKDDHFMNALVVRVKPGVTADFEEKLMKQANQVAQGWTLDLETMAEMRQSMNKVALIPLIIFSIVCGFLIINVALGLFGVLWYNINRRISEIGLRRAIGASSRQVYRQFVGEVLVVATLGVLGGLLIAAQFPLLQVFEVQTGVYLAAMAASVVLIYALAAACAAYPSRQAASIHPALALHED